MGVTRSYDYDDISQVDPDTDVTGAELEELTDASETTLHSHAGGGGSGDVVGPASSTDNAIARFDGTTGKTIQNSDVTISDTGDIEAVSTDAGATGPSLSTYHNSASPVADDVVGSIDFYGEDSASNKHQYAKITGVIVDTTDGSEDGALSFQISSGSGTLLERLRLSGSNITVTNADIKMGGNKIDLDADNDTSIHADTDDQIDIEIAGADDFRFTANTFTALTGSSIVLPGGDIQTQLDAKATTSALSTHESDTTTHGATGAVVGTTNTQTLTNKTLTTPTIAQINNATAPGVKLQLRTQTDNSNSIASATTAGLSIQYGWGQLAGNGTNNLVEAVTFPTAFTTLYHVSATWIGATAADSTAASSITDLEVGSSQIWASTDSQSTTGMNVRLGTTATTSASRFYAYSWTAVGVV